MASSPPSPASLATTDDLTQSIRVSLDGHYFVQPDGEPFYWLQDWGYEIFKIPDRHEVEQFLRDRARKGFTVIMAPITGITGSLTRPSRDGELPFVDEDPLRPNPRYFENVDGIVEMAFDLGLRMALLPTWGGLVTGGFADSPFFNVDTAEHYGRWIAARYRGKGVIWVLGGDTNPLWPRAVGRDQFGKDNGSETETSRAIADFTPVFDSFAKGIQDSDGSALIAYHPTGGNWRGTPEARTSLYLADRSWLAMNMIQSGHHLVPGPVNDLVGMEAIWNASYSYAPIGDEYRSEPTRPIIDSEPRFDNEAINLNPENGYWKTYDVRNAAYHALFAGAAGVAYADLSVGMLAPELNLYPEVPFEQALASPGSEQMGLTKALMLSRPYFTRIPDQSVIVGDPGRGEPYVAATRDSEGGYAMVYLPHGQKVTVDLTKISGSTAVAWWFDPRTGDATRIDGAFPTSETRTFVPPTAGADIDWILVLDDEGRGFPPPGQS